jgi:hypothetical protein
MNQFQQMRNWAMLLTVVALLGACSKNNKPGLVVPKEAVYALHVNGKTLSEKLPWEDIKNNPVWSEISGDSTLPALAKKILDNPENSGIDIKNDMSFFLLNDVSGYYAGGSGVIKDAAKFEQFATEVLDGASESENNGIKYRSAYPVCIGWSKDKFFVVSDASQIGNALNGFGSMMNDSNATTKRRDIGATCKSLFELKAENSLGENEKFSTLVKDNADIHFWMNGEEAMKGNMAMAMLAMTNLSKLYQGNISAMSIRFEEGKISMKGKWYGGKEMTELMTKYAGSSIDKDLLKRLPNKDMAVLMAMNFKPEFIKEIIKISGMEGLINIGMSKTDLGFTIDDAINANKGDIVFAMSDVVRTSDSSSYTIGDKKMTYPTVETNFNFIFATAIKDKEAFGKLIRAGKSAFDKVRIDSTDANPKMAYSNNDKYFVLGRNKTLTDEYLAGKNNNSAAADLLGSGPMSGFINLQLLMKGFPPLNTADSTDKAIYDLSLKMWDRVIFTGGGMKSGAMTQDAEITLLDTRTNSLKQLNTYLSALAKLQKAKDASYDVVEAPKAEKIEEVIAAPVEEAAPSKKKK